MCRNQGLLPELGRSGPEERGQGEMAKTTIEFSNAAFEQLGRLSGEFTTTKAEILRRALGLYAFVCDQVKQPDTRLGIVDADGTAQKIIVLPELEMKGYGSGPSGGREENS